MEFSRTHLVLVLGLTAPVWCQTPAAPPTGGASKIPGFDINALDRTANPCVNFYQFACGTWMKNNPIPADQSVWGRFNELAERNRVALQDILERASSSKPGRDAVTQKIGDFYYSCMDEEGIEKQGVQPLQTRLKAIDALTDKKALEAHVVKMHKQGVDAFFGFGAEPDFKDSKQMIAGLDQGGLGLPDRDYYFKDDARSKELREKYVAHVQKMFELAGEPAAQAAADAKTVMSIETALAKVSLDRVKRRDPSMIYHKTALAKLTSDAPAFDWKTYFQGVGAPSFDSLNVAVPEFFTGFSDLWKSTSLADLKTYVRWHTIHANAPLMPRAFVTENFNFYGKTLTGAQELRPRWKRCVDMTDGSLGEALGQKYVEATFGAEGKRKTLEMVERIEKALQDDLHQLPWMTPATKEQALTKLKGIANKIGYPDKWRDYSSVTVKRGDAAGNNERADAFEVARRLQKIGHPTDPSEWEMTPPTVNAYYDPLINNINFPAGILQPPFYQASLDEAVNYGGIGAVIGHELTHGFDDEGRQFDATGNLRDWWTAEDAKEFEKRAECFIQEYESFSPVEGVHLNGKLTLGENTADNGGLRLAYMALMASLENKRMAKIDGFTPEQRLFLGWGQVWCQNIRPEASRLRAQTDPHSPGEFRVNGVVSNMPEFQQAYGCKEGDPMVRRPSCRVW